MEVIWAFFLLNPYELVPHAGLEITIRDSLYSGLDFANGQVVQERIVLHWVLYRSHLCRFFRPTQKRDEMSEFSLRKNAGLGHMKDKTTLTQIRSSEYMGSLAIGWPRN